MSNNSYYNDQWRIINEPNKNKVSNYSMNFDSASSDYIDAGTGLGNSLGTYTGDASISLWFKAETTTNNEGLFTITPFNGSDFGNLRINISSNNLLFVSSGTASYKYISFTDTTSWHHLVCIFKSGDITNSKIYLDGVDKTTTNVGTFPSSLSLTGLKTIIGAYRGTSNTFNGKIDQVTFFDYSLSASQVSTLYGGGTAVTNPMTISPKPIYYYQLGDQSVYNGANYLVPNNSLSGSEGYSPYALSLDGVNDYLDSPQVDLGSTNSISFWINNSVSNSGTIFGDPYTFSKYAIAWGTATNVIVFRLGNGDNGYWQLTVSSGLLQDGNWHHHCLTRDGVTINYYIDGVLQTNVTNNTLDASAGTNTSIENTMARSNGTSPASGKLSNVSFWNFALTSTQVTEIYNQGVPSNLNTFSGTAPIAWWQIGSNSSFNPNPTGTEGTWTCLDEIGTNNAPSSNSMTNDAITNGPGYSANGLGTSSIEIANDAPYSTANGLSENMDVLDRVTDVAPS